MKRINISDEELTNILDWYNGWAITYYLNKGLSVPKNHRDLAVRLIELRNIEDERAVIINDVVELLMDIYNKEASSILNAVLLLDHLYGLYVNDELPDTDGRRLLLHSYGLAKSIDEDEIMRKFIDRVQEKE